MDSQSRLAVIQPGIEPGSVVTPLALRCSALDCCATRETSEHGEVINYTLDGVSIHKVTAKIQVSFLTQLPERKETTQGFYHEANGDLNSYRV